MIAKVLILVVILIVALPACILIASQILARIREQQMHVRRIPAMFTIMLDAEGKEHDSLRLLFAEEIDIVRNTKRVVPIADGIWEHLDEKGSMLMLKFDDSELFLPFLRERNGMYESPILRRVTDTPQITSRSSSRS